MIEAFGGAVMPRRTNYLLTSKHLSSPTEKSNVVPTFAAVLLGVGCGVVLLAVTFLIAFRRKATKKGGFGTAQNHDVFDRDPSFYSSLDKDKMGS